jgi:crotonobetainyl-CoA:carnitine CoA-transferase CaiB-like acyl-CoA transferase
VAPEVTASSASGPASEAASGGPLAGIRVLDLATERGELAGRILGDLGAEVIKIEPPAGATGRRRPPFDERSGAGAAETNGTSLYWAAVGIGKRSVVLDLDDAASRERLVEAVRGSDVLIESFAPGLMATWGLAERDLREVNPGLIYASIAPFGQHGPKADWPATELTIEAAGGLVILQGDRDRPPIPVGYPQAAFHAAAQAAADCVIALNERAHSGLGQHLDTSMQEAVVWTLLHATGFPPNVGGNPPNTCEARATEPETLIPGRTGRWQCADGWVLAGIGGGYGQAVVAEVMAVLREEGALDDELAAVDWSQGLVGPGGLAVGPDALPAVLEAIRVFFVARTKAEIMAFAVARDLQIGGVRTVKDLRNDPQLEARGYWTEVDGRVHPGPFARLSRTPIVEPRPAPTLDEARGLLDAPRAATWNEGADEQRSDRAEPEEQRLGEAFAGLKVADFSWVGVGPICAKALADHGATVVHVESSTRPDILRLAQPAKDGILGLDRSQFFADYNTSKLGLALNLATPEGIAIARRLIDWADVVLESFTPGTIQRLGLDHEVIRAERPDLVWYSTCLLGQTGPDRTFGGFGGHGSALAGLHGITGWPDRMPSGTWGAYTDMIAPHFGVAALAAALLERRRTGLGQHIDLAQVEAGIRFMEPLVLDYTVNGRVAGGVGHASLTDCPHSVYPTRGVERYLAISVDSDARWQALAATVDGLASLAALDLDGRRAHEETIDAAIAAWCADREPYEAEATLIAAGVPAAVAQFPTDLYQDPQLADRGFFVTLDHAEMGPTPYDGLITRFSAKRRLLHGPAPMLGQHGAFVLRELLDLDESEIVQAAAAGALS